MAFEGAFPVRTKMIIDENMSEQMSHLQFIIRICGTLIFGIKSWKDAVEILVSSSIVTWSLTLREEHRLRVFENRVLRRIFGPKSDEVTGGWGKLHNEELHNLYSSPSIIRVIKSRRMRWAGNAARMGRGGIHTGYWWESQKERDNWEDQDVDG
jgi:hypothetical protein